MIYNYSEMLVDLIRFEGLKCKIESDGKGIFNLIIDESNGGTYYAGCYNNEEAFYNFVKFFLKIQIKLGK